MAELELLRDDLRRVRSARAAHGARRLDATCATWRRLGPVLFTYDDALDIDLNLFHNKDAVFFPEAGHRRRTACAASRVLHRPMWDLSETKADQGVIVPAGITDPGESIWISYVPVEAVAKDLSALTLWSGHRFVAGARVPVRGHQDRRRSRARCGSRRAGCCCTTA